MNRHRQITVRALSPERAAALRNTPRPAIEKPTRFHNLSDKKILELDLDPSLSREDSLAISAEMSRRGLYEN